MNHNQKKDRRNRIRKKCNVVIDLSEKYMGIIRDISTGGIFIETINPFEIGQSVPMSFPHFSDFPRKFRLSGKVVRIVENGVAIKFTGKLQQSYNVRREQISAKLLYN